VSRRPHLRVALDEGIDADSTGEGAQRSECGSLGAGANELLGDLGRGRLTWLGGCAAREESCCTNRKSRAGLVHDGLLYISVGAPCNVCERQDPIFATIARMKPDGTDFEVFASGVRNSVGFDWHPQTKALWFTDNGRDELGDDIPPDEIDHADKAGLHFGFPYCHAGKFIDPAFGSGKSCASYEPPALALGAHVAALGMRFNTGKMFPEKYRNALVVAEHGSWNRARKNGYRVMIAQLDGDRVVSYEPLVNGWLNEQTDEVSGRPTDVEWLDDGSLLISDDYRGAVYRVTYHG
jgi:glucose/arabinose dehydrogenase